MHMHKENKKVYIHTLNIIIAVHARIISEVTKVSVRNCKLLSLSTATYEHV